MMRRARLGSVGACAAALALFGQACGRDGLPLELADAGAPPQFDAFSADAADAAPDAVDCAPAEITPCYDGAPGTLNVGACREGFRVCDADGRRWSAECIGQVVPVPETCGTSVDDDCDGELNEEGTDCTCAPGVGESCYSGPAGTQGVGACAAGVRTCDVLGLSWGACIGEILPHAEQCTTAIDDDCDGEANEEGPDCLCEPAQTVGCYTGPFATIGLGACKSGIQTCNATGSGFGVCEDEVTPKASDLCSTVADDDCDHEPECPGDIDSVHTLALDGLELVGPGGVTAASNRVYLLIRSGSGARLVSFDQTGKIAQDTPVSANAFESTIVAGSINSNPALHFAARHNGTWGSAPEPLSGDLALQIWYPGSWARGYPMASGSLVNRPLLAVQNALYVVSKFEGSFDVGLGSLAAKGSSDFVIARFDQQSGDPIWQRRLAAASFSGSGPLNVLAASSHPGPGGCAVVVGGRYDAVDFGGGALPGATGGLYLACFDGNGMHTWSKGFIGAFDDFLTLKPTLGGLFVSGSSGTPIDLGGGTLSAGIFVAELEWNGAHTWSTSIPGCYARAMTVTGTAPETIYVSGHCPEQQPYDAGHGPVVGLVNVALTKSGPVWERGYSQKLLDSVALVSNGSLWWVGNFQSTLSLVTVPEKKSVGATDVFWARIMP